jgi:hypothetical protein
MKRIRADDHPRKQPKAERLLRYRPPRPRTIKRVRVRVRAQPEQIEADEFVQYHLARIGYAKEVERQSFAAIAEYLATTAPADLRRECDQERKRTQ